MAKDFLHSAHLAPLGLARVSVFNSVRLRTKGLISGQFCRYVKLDNFDVTGYLELFWCVTSFSLLMDLGHGLHLEAPGAPRSRGQEAYATREPVIQFEDQIKKVGSLKDPQKPFLATQKLKLGLTAKWCRRSIKTKRNPKIRAQTTSLQLALQVRPRRPN